ncbi:uncharacterized protein LOC134179782 [Corticium candelabrum]|uniref:uncharacterized protein LOC134179782 n=1 Tax=Corticium candelabrum TaxID=121492 RepID=UPI002E26674B|nr:uncharacterized protein LOC134179782 [Corticium candelabrum]
MVSMAGLRSLVAVVILLSCFAAIRCSDSVAWVQFLVSVNDTWYPDEYHKLCIATVKTPQLRPNEKPNMTNSIQVGACDHGPLVFSVQGTQLDITFHSSVIEDASPPSCSINWNLQYNNPTNYGTRYSPLPGCATAESREGYHMTYYWFYILDWLIA